MGKNVLKRIKEGENFMINFYKQGIKIKETFEIEELVYGLKLDISGIEIRAIYIGRYFEYIYLLDLIYDMSDDGTCLYLN